MKTSLFSSLGNSFRKASLFVATIGIAGTLAAAAPAALNGPEKPTQEASATASMKAVVFRLENTMKFKAIIKNPSGKDIRVMIKNASNDLVYEDKPGRMATYIRRFDLSGLADGDYTFEITSGKETHKQTISVETVTTRVASVQ